MGDLNVYNLVFTETPILHMSKNLNSGPFSSPTDSIRHQPNSLLFPLFWVGDDTCTSDLQQPTMLTTV